MTIGAAAAVERRRKRNQGEEQMTAYRRDEKDQGWEFKILRSASGASKRPDQLARVLAEESSASWELLEKFDDGRLRLKRSASARDRDADLPSSYDPYRTQYGISEGALTAYWVFGILAVIVPVIVPAYLVDRRLLIAGLLRFQHGALGERHVSRETTKGVL